MLKAVMAVAGLLMVLFLLAHVSGNPLVFAGKRALDCYPRASRTLGRPLLPSPGGPGGEGGRQRGIEVVRGGRHDRRTAHEHEGEDAEDLGGEMTRRLTHETRE